MKLIFPGHTETGSVTTDVAGATAADQEEEHRAVELECQETDLETATAAAGSEAAPVDETVLAATRSRTNSLENGSESLDGT